MMAASGIWFDQTFYVLLGAACRLQVVMRWDDVEVDVV